MSVVARGSLSDGSVLRLFAAALGRRLSGEVIIERRGHSYRVAWRDGAVVGAHSPNPADNVARVALNLGVLSSTQAQRAAHVLASHPDQSELEVVAEVAHLGPDLTARLARRVAAARAARAIGLTEGDYVVHDQVPAWAQVPPIDARWILYNGVRSHYTVDRSERELTERTRGLRLKPGADLSGFGFGEGEARILAALEQGMPVPPPHDLDRQVALSVGLVLAVVGDAEVVDGLAPAPPAPAPPTPTPHGDRRPSRPIRIAAAGTSPSSRNTPPGGVTSPMVGTGSGRTPTAPRSVVRGRRVSTDPGADVRATTDGVAAARTRTDSVASRPRTRSRPVAASRTSSPSLSRRLRTNSSSSPSTTSRVRGLIEERSAALDRGVDHYELLGVELRATSDEIRARYFTLARDLHPDRLAALGIDDDDRVAQRLFAAINEAFGVLSDVERRRQYEQLRRAGGEAAVRADDAEAESKARRALDSEERFRVGEMALRRYQFDIAVTEFQRAVELNPEEADHHALLGWAVYLATPDKASSLPVARDHMRKAIAVDPTCATPYLYLGRIARMEGEIEDAARHLRTAHDLAPRNAEVDAELRAVRSGAVASKGGSLWSRLVKK